MFLTTADLQALAQHECVYAPGDGGVPAAEYLQAWYTVLLRQTLEFAGKSVPYYRERDALLGLSAGAFQSISELSRHPVLYRANLVAGYASFFSDAVADRACSTSGTTGRRILIYGNSAEQEAALALRRMAGDGRGEDDMILLRVIPGNRRTHIASGAAAPQSRVVTVGYSPAYGAGWFDHADHIVEVLTDTYYLGGRAGRISAMHLTPPVILDYLTRDLLQRGIDPASFRIAEIALSGAFCSRHTRRLAQEVWKARLHHSYSCAEIRAENLAIVDDPDTFAISRAVFCEILDVDTLEPVEVNEAGLVVFTSLYPFQQVMPLIRYSMGDIAQRRGEHGPVVTAIRPIGRAGECMAVGPRRFIGPRDGFQAVTSFEAVPQLPQPRFDLRIDDGVLRLDLEVAFPPESGVLTADDIAARLLDEIRAYGYPDAPGHSVCRLLPKNTLKSFPRIIPDR